MAQDALTLLMDDHREVEDMFARLEAGGMEIDARKDLVDQLTIEIVRHSVAEEQYLYPFVHDHLPGGEMLHDEELSDHARIEVLLKQLDGMSADNLEFEATLRELMTEVRSHVAEEESTLFNELREATTPSQREELGGKIEMAKRVAPTRPHPSAPDTPPMNKLLGPGTGLVDRIRDALTGRGTSQK